MRIPIIIESKSFCKAISWFMDVGAITLYPFIICRNKQDITLLNHEAIHIQQQKELLVVPFFIMYFLNWGYNLIRYKGDTQKAYRNIIFEKEAYDNERDLGYLGKRSIWAWAKRRIN